MVATNWYNKYSHVPYIGFYKLFTPAILLCDVELVKQILCTNYDSFNKNDVELSEKHDQLFSKSPFFTYGENWKACRKTLVQVLATNKLKNIMSVPNSVGGKLINFIRNNAENTEYEARELCLRFTTENLIESTFSIDGRCFGDKGESEFVTALKTMVKRPSILVMLKFFLSMLIPKWISDYVPISFTPKPIVELFEKLVKENKDSRSERCRVNDLFQALMERQGRQSDSFLQSHTFTLFFESIETSSSALSHTLYELARNPYCQDRVYNEIVESLNKLDIEGDININEMTYLEGVILEAMRIHPPVMVLQKVCTKEFVFPKCGNRTEPLTIYPGTPVHIPVQAIHMDPKYYPSPDEFIPERFIGDEQRNHRGTYLTYSEGPRYCVGMRFAMAQVKYALIHIIKNFHVELSANQKPLVASPELFVQYPKDGILVRFVSRS